ncbi:MAG: hypothetical protein H7Z42_10425 [Roseiflexaceae bacterium]|nr:hypothetical protein [Roseiflexaceae bacterium]
MRSANSRAAEAAGWDCEARRRGLYIVSARSGGLGLASRRLQPPGRRGGTARTYQA